MNTETAISCVLSGACWAAAVACLWTVWEEIGAGNSGVAGFAAAMSLWCVKWGMDVWPKPRESGEA